jgi:hypothetical protein
VFETVTIADLARGALPARVAARPRDKEAWLPH